MKLRRRFLVVAAALLASLLFTSVAVAQEITNDRSNFTSERRVWLRDSRMLEGKGINAGPAVLHPGIAVEGGYDSNWFQRTQVEGADIVNGAPNAPVRGAGILRVTPSLTLSIGSPDPMKPPPTLLLRAAVIGTYREFVGADEIRRQRNMGGSAALRLDILPGRVVGGAVFAGYQRTIQPNTLGALDQSFNRSDITGGAEVAYSPGAGTLEMRLTYQLFTSLFEETEGVGFSNMQNEFSLRTTWRVRPRTTIFQDTSFRLISYLQPERAFYFLNNSQPLRSRLGVQSLLTPRFQVLGALGYAASFQLAAQSPLVKQYDTITGQAEITFFPLASGEPQNTTLSVSSIALGYTRDFQNSFLGNFVGIDRGYARASYFYGNRVVFSFEGGVAALQYPDVVQNTGAGVVVARNSFTDIRANGTVFGEYRFTDSLGLNATFDYIQNFSDNRIPQASTPGGQSLFFDLNWRRFQALLGVRYFL